MKTIDDYDIVVFHAKVSPQTCGYQERLLLFAYILLNLDTFFFESWAGRPPNGRGNGRLPTRMMTKKMRSLLTYRRCHYSPYFCYTGGTNFICVCARILQARGSLQPMNEIGCSLPVFDVFRATFCRRGGVMVPFILDFTPLSG